MSKTKVDLFEGNLYEGSRGEDFKEFIISLLKKGKLKDKYIQILTTEEAMEKYGFAFTADSRVNPENNYECYEQMGDAAASHFMVSYFFRRFPQLECSAGNKVVCRLRINYGAKQSFSSIATELGFWKFITCPETGNIPKKKYRNTHMKDLLEDVFEAFLGCTEKLLDEAFRQGVGYAIIYDILSNIFDKIPISLEYEDLMDAKTRLKETFDLNWIGNQLGKLVYVNTVVSTIADDGKPKFMHLCKIYRAPPGVSTGMKTPENMDEVINKPPWRFDYVEMRYYNTKWVFISQAMAISKSESEQTAAEIAIKILKDGIMYNGEIKSFFKEFPPEYEFFCKK
jgi:dsRNA-specific ribonuclease